MQAAVQEARQLRERIVRCALGAQKPPLEASFLPPTGAHCAADRRLCHSLLTGLAGTVPQLASAACSLAVLEASVGALAQLTSLVREADASLADARACAAAERLSHYGAAVDAFRGAAAALLLVAPPAGDAQGNDAVPERLRLAASARVGAAAAALREALSAELDCALEAAGWPPPLAQGAESPAAWRPATPQVACIAALLDGVRGACAPAPPADRTAPPPAWSLLRLAAPLRERLCYHFTSGGPADREDRPEWPLAQALRVATAFGPAAAAVLPPAPPGCVQAPHAAALAACVAEEAAGVLRARVLPQLHARGSGAEARAAWLHLADEARDFDARLARMAGEHAARACGATRLLVEKAQWAQRWTEAELEAALRQLDAATEAEGAWAVDAQAGGEGGEGNAPALPRPACAPRAIAIIHAAAARAAALPHPAQARAFLRDVPAAAATDFLGRLQRRAHGAAAFGDLAGPESAARCCACVCAAAALEEGLEALGEAPQLWRDEQALAARTHAQPRRGGVFAEEVAAAAALQEEWVAALAQALARQLLGDAASLLHTARPGGGGGVLAPALHSLGGGLAGLHAALEPAHFARLWCVPPGRAARRV